VLFPLGAFVDPLLDGGDLRGCERAACGRRGHAALGIGVRDAEIDAAGFGFAGRECGERSLFGIQADAGHALAFVGAVASEAVVGEDGADLAVEVDGPGGEGTHRPSQYNPGKPTHNAIASNFVFARVEADFFR
jgi:hypothetical protein